MRRDLVIQGMEKAEVLSAVFVLVIPGNTVLWESQYLRGNLLKSKFILDLLDKLLNEVTDLVDDLQRPLPVSAIL